METTTKHLKSYQAEGMAGSHQEKVNDLTKNYIETSWEGVPFQNMFLSYQEALGLMILPASTDDGETKRLHPRCFW